MILLLLGINDLVVVNEPEQLRGDYRSTEVGTPANPGANRYCVVEAC